MTAKRVLSPVEKYLAALMFIWAVATTTSMSSINPPVWASGFFYLVWWGMVFFAVYIVSAAPAIVVVVIANKLFGLLGVLVLGFVYLWVVDEYVRSSLLFIPVTLGSLLMMVYTCKYLHRRRAMKF